MRVRPTRLSFLHRAFVLSVRLRPAPPDRSIESTLDAYLSHCPISPSNAVQLPPGTLSVCHCVPAALTGGPGWELQPLLVRLRAPWSSVVGDAAISRLAWYSCCRPKEEPPAPSSCPSRSDWIPASRDRLALSHRLRLLETRHRARLAAVDVGCPLLPHLAT